MRDARLEKEISLEEIADKTKINREFFKENEDGEFDFLPEFYGRHFVKSYLHCIGKGAMRLSEKLSQRASESEQHEAEGNEARVAPKIQ